MIFSLGVFFTPAPIVPPPIVRPGNEGTPLGVFRHRPRGEISTMI